MRTVTITGQLSDDGQQLDGRFIKEDRTYPLQMRRRARGSRAPRGPHPSPIVLPPEVLAQYAGDYRCGRMAVTVTVDDGALAVQFTGQPKLAVLAASLTEFFSRDLDLSATFEAGSSGDATGFILHDRGRDARYVRSA
jgi:hypothetical protein